ncbi:hypothetical protein GTP55_25750 [Duganella sp. FT109W]|uniref:Uncharacterized protein n=1 Tax=Duganella margarita TaxID=2692170 RepID=A0ABW9WR48_9BURK|nr:hypothetical protein [Duganella margarita]MYN42753.1 hypothetical protein [Duganella margarita]
MKAWVARRREGGAVLAAPVPAIEGAGLLELVVVEITEEGNRRPIRVARLHPLGEQRILAQLKLPALVQLKGWKLVLSGIEETRNDDGQVRGVAQTWLCELRPPENALGFRVKDTYISGVRRPRAALHQASGTCGKLMVAGDFSNALQRHTTCAEMHGYQISTFAAKRIIDCYIEFMGDSSFGLGGLRVREAHQDRPQRLERDGWLCEFDVKERELTKAEYRALR